MKYYEIHCYPEGHEKEFAFYLKSDRPLTKQEIVDRLENEFLGADGLELHHIYNISQINIITAREFKDSCDIDPFTHDDRRLKERDTVVMHTCMEALDPDNYGKVWTCRTDEFTTGEGIYEQNLVFLEGYSGSFATKYLQKVNL